jgi:hypothetical protein
MGMDNERKQPADRLAEWFVPTFGPSRFRLAVGLLFLPYTGMVLSYAVLGSLLAPEVHWDRVGAIVLIYFLGLGIAAHALDALGSRGVKPWGAAFNRDRLWVAVVVSLSLAYGIAGYYMIRHVPFLLVVAVLEGFFVFAYNLEWFGGRFHRDKWFAFSWGFLPVTAGYIMQTNRLDTAALVVGVSAAFFSRIEIKVSRPYKALKRRADTAREEELLLLERYEIILKSISLGVCLLAVGFLLGRLTGG